MSGTSIYDSTGSLAAMPGTATLPAVPGATNQLSGFSITGGGATAASIVQGTITGLGIKPLTFDIAVPAGATAGISPVVVNFTNPIPASGPNVPIVLNLPSFGAGNTNAVGNIWGFY
jgi:hypothetical protein